MMLLPVPALAGNSRSSQTNLDCKLRRGDAPTTCWAAACDGSKEGRHVDGRQAHGQTMEGAIVDDGHLTYNQRLIERCSRRR